MLTRMRRPLLSVIVRCAHNGRAHTTLVVNVGHNALHGGLGGCNVGWFELTGYLVGGTLLNVKGHLFCEYRGKDSRRGEV